MAAALIAVIATAGCGAPRQLLIGIALGTSSQPGVELAVDEINRQGGVRGRMLAIDGLGRTEENAPNPVNTVDWAERLASNPELVAVIGHADSDSTLAASSLYNQYGIPQIVTIASNPAITEAGPWTYRIGTSDDVQGSALAEHAITDWNKRRAVVIWGNDTYGRALAESFERQFEELGGTVLASLFHRFPIQEADRELLTVEFARLAAAEPPDLLVLLNRPDSARTTLKLARSAGLSAPSLSADNVSMLLGWADLDLAPWEGSRFARYFDPEREGARAGGFVEEIVSRTRASPDYDSALAYDAVYLLAHAFAEGATTRKGLRSSLEGLTRRREPIDGVAGPYVLGPDRESRRALHIVEVRDRRQQRVLSIGPG